MSQMNVGSGPQPGKPGQMTAVMRAMTQNTGPKVLRIGLVQGGRIIEERIIKQRTSVTVGPSEKAMFVIQADVPAQYKLFELVGNDYYLNFLDGMSGRVALQTGITDLPALKGQAKRVGNAYQVKLTEDARGKVVVGDTTFLFQFVAPPPPQPRPQLPLSVKGGLASQIDWNLTVIAAFSFMLHFGLVGAMYSDWMDPVINEDVGIQGLIDLAKSVPPPPVEEKPVAEDKGADKKADKPADKPSSGGAASKTPAGGGAPRVSDARAAALAAQADAMAMQLLGAKGGAGPAVAGVLSNASDIPLQDLTGAAKSGAGVTSATGDLRMGGAGGGPVQPGKSGSGLAGIGGSTQGTASGGAGTGRAVEGPKAADPTVSGMSSSAPVSGLEATIAKLRPRFKSCYQRGLSQDPTMQGKVTLNAKVGPNGEVSNVDTISNNGLSQEVVDCIRGVIKRAEFAPPGGAGSSVNIPVSFVQQK